MIALAALCIGSVPAKADVHKTNAKWRTVKDNTANFKFSDDHTYFTWGDAAQAATTDYIATHKVGLVVWNGNVDSNNRATITLHCKKDASVSNTYHFYCDPECTIECIGVGYLNDSNWGSGRMPNLSWWPMVDNDNVNYPGHTDGYRPGQFTFTDNDIKYISARRTSMDSPHNFTMMLEALTNAIKNGPSAMTVPRLKLKVYMHSTYTVNSSEFIKYSPGTLGGRKIYLCNWAEAITGSDNPYTITCTRFNQTAGSETKLSGAMFLLAPAYSGGMDDTSTYFMNWDPSIINSSRRIVTFDNNTSTDTDIAVTVQHNGLFMDSYLAIKNSKGTTTPHGVGVKLAAAKSGVTPYHNAAIELGTDNPDQSVAFKGGTCQITGQKIGIDVYAGTVRLKGSYSELPIDLNGNTQTFSLAHGAYISKWSHDISSFNNVNTVITLKNMKDWASGDIIFSSGMSNYSTSGNWAPNTYASLKSTDVSQIKFAPETDLTKYYSIIFDNPGVHTDIQTGGADYDYPAFRLSLDAIYNTRLNTWYPNLNAAGTATNIADGDELIYYQNVVEPKAVTLNNKLTIRAAKPGNADDEARVVYDLAETITSTLAPTAISSTATNKSFVTVASSKTVTFGGSKTGKLIFDMDSNGRAFTVSSGTLNLYSGITVKNGKGVDDYGGAVYIKSGATLNLTNTTLSGNTCKSKRAIYQGGTMRVKSMPTFGASDYVYLPKGNTITKVGEINTAVTIPVKLDSESEIKGRDILVSKKSSTDSSEGKVIAGDASRLKVSLTNKDLRVIYNALGNDTADYTPKDVIELANGLADITISKEGLKKGDSATFVVTLSSDTAKTPLYTIVLTGTDDSGTKVSVKVVDLELATKYTVTESTWSWAYTPAKSAITKTTVADAAQNIFEFTNTPKSGAVKHAESIVNNKLEVE